jgi:hypothetical protein
MNIFATNFRLITGVMLDSGFFNAIHLFAILFLWFGNSIKLISFLSFIFISVLFGYLFTRIIYKIRLKKNIEKKTGIIGLLGLALGSLAPGCVACGIGLAALFGISAGLLHYLPLKGLEISIASVALLMTGIWKISSDFLKCDECRIKNERRYKK